MGGEKTMSAHVAGGRRLTRTNGLPLALRRGWWQHGSPSATGDGTPTLGTLRRSSCHEFRAKNLPCLFARRPAGCFPGCGTRGAARGPQGALARSAPPGPQAARPAPAKGDLQQRRLRLPLLSEGQAAHGRGFPRHAHQCADGQPSRRDRLLHDQLGLQLLHP